MSERLRLLDLFSGIGGFSLGLERSGGFETVAFCEIEEFPRRVLAKHWPKVPCYHDIRELTADRLAADGITVDAICGGFPCQDISVAGKGAGLAGKRSGLWAHFARLIGEVRPGVVFVENVAKLLDRGIDRVVGDLAGMDYHVVGMPISASQVGLRHKRPRQWLMAYPNADDAAGIRAGIFAGEVSQALKARSGGADELVPSPSVERHHSYGRIVRAVHGLPDWLDRTSTLGNAVVPQIPELLGRAWMEASHG